MAPRSGVAVAALALLKEAVGILTAGDHNGPSFVVQPGDFPYFISIRERGDCAGAVIGDKYVVTAAHCFCPKPDKAPDIILSDGSKVKPTKAFFNPECMFSCDDDGPNRCDVAVLEFAAALPAAASSIKVYADSDEVGKEIVITGFGSTGDAADAVCVDGDGKMRRATNIVTAVEGSPGGVIKYAMDQGRSGEGMAQDGDSGGPAVITKGGVAYIAGVNSGTAEANPCDYGSIDQYARLSAHKTFIDKVVDPDDDSIDATITFESAAGTDFAARVTPVVVLALLWLHVAWA